MNTPSLEDSEIKEHLNSLSSAELERIYELERKRKFEDMPEIEESIDFVRIVNKILNERYKKVK